MSATVIAYWAGITDQQMDAQPGFYNDDTAWANWVAERYSEPSAVEAIHALGADAILTHTTDGMSDDEVAWVTPQELLDAVARLKQAVEQSAPEAAPILEVYSRGANRIDPIDREFIQDLNDVAAIASWTQAEGADKMTLSVNW